MNCINNLAFTKVELKLVFCTHAYKSDYRQIHLRDLLKESYSFMNSTSPQIFFPTLTVHSILHYCKISENVSNCLLRLRSMNTENIVDLHCIYLT